MNSMNNLTKKKSDYFVLLPACNENKLNKSLLDCIVEINPHDIVVPPAFVRKCILEQEQIKAYNKAKQKISRTDKKASSIEIFKKKIFELDQFVHRLRINEIIPETFESVYNEYLTMNHTTVKKFGAIADNDTSVIIISNELKHLAYLLRSIISTLIDKNADTIFSESLGELSDAIMGLHRKKSHVVNFLRRLRDFFRKS
jgi:hypothetical protein